jgi:hypothetical protein
MPQAVRGTILRGIMQHKLWIDMTDLSQWKGNMTGVQRVIYEIALRYHNSDTLVGYFVYDDRSRRCYEVPFEAIDVIINAPVTNAKSAASPTKRMASMAFGFVQRQYNGLSDETKEKIPESVRLGGKLALKGTEKVARTILHNVREMRARRMSRAVKTSIQQGHTTPFKKGDTIFVIGASWDSKTKINDIMRLKYEYHLRYVQVIHDVIPAFDPYLFGDGFAADFDTRIFESIANADLLLCVSKATRDELLRFCEVARIKPPVVEVIRLGDDYTQSSHPVRPKMNLKNGEPFALCVGTYEVRKNHHLLYYAVKEALYRGVDVPKVIIIGRPGWLVHDLTYTLQNDPAVHDKIQYLGGVSDEEKTWLFQNCSFTVFPSVFEGWGLPVGESLYYEKPCISSSISSMPEIGGDIVDYFSPFNSGECLDKMIEYSNPEVLARRTDQIRAQYKPYLWDQTYQQVKSFIEK